ncbi:MAG: SMC-Scp complex subunit ScpB [Corynebacterium sp.]|nr:SMC-Scp complex subunit ScpB [Corynebacterium sp.]
MQRSTLHSQLESLLVVADEPLTEAAVAELLDVPATAVGDAFAQLAAHYREIGSGFNIRHVDGGWRLYTAPDNAEIVEKLVLAGSHTKLTRAALETLAVVAYKQPVTRAQVSAIRGVNVDGVMRTLTLRGLIREAGEDASARLYETTELFLELLGLDSLHQLPNLAPYLPDVDRIDDVV